MALQTRTVASTSSSATASRRPVPFQAGSLRRSVAARAAEAEASTSTPTKTYAKVAPLTWEVDKETPRDVFAFGGSAPERANGRVAMLGAASVILTEVSSHTPALEQVGNSIPSIILVSLTMTLATVLPKLVSGSSLADLHASASSANLKSEGLLGQALALFDQSFELWTGRIAMLGFTGMLVVEAVKGDAFF